MIALGCDHTGIELKEKVKELLREMNLDFEDFGAYENVSTDYPVWGYRAAKAVAQGKCDRGILICGTGVGIGLAANKVDGIRCVTCSEPYSALMGRKHNNCNMISIGARVLGVDLALMIIKTFLETDFEGERHQRRVDQIMQIEQGTENF